MWKPSVDLCCSCSKCMLYLLLFSMAQLNTAALQAAGDETGATPSASAAVADQSAEPIWQKSGVYQNFQSADPVPAGWIHEYHSLDFEYVVSVSPDGAVNVTLQNLRPSDGLPVDQPIDPQSEAVSDPGVVQPTPMPYRWTSVSIEPFLHLKAYQKVSVGGQVQETWVDCEVWCRMRGVARQRRWLQLAPDASGGGWADLPLYGPEFQAGAERRLDDFRLRSQDVPALNLILQKQFRSGRMSAITYDSDEELVSPATRADEVTQRSFLSMRQGMVLVRRAHGGWVQAQENMELYIGDTVKTLSDGEAVVVLRDAAVIRVRPDTELTIPAKNNTTKKVSFIQMVRGVLWARAKRGDSSLKVSVPNAICGVRNGGPYASDAYGCVTWVRIIEPAPDLPQVKYPVTCLRCYSGRADVWGAPTDRDREGPLLTTLLPGQSLCVGIDGVVEPAADSGTAATPRVVDIELQGQSSESRVALAAGDLLRLSVKLSPANPFQVRLSTFDRGRLRLTQERTERLPGLPGPGGRRVPGAPTERRIFEFRPLAQASGEARIVVELQRPGVPAASIRYELVVSLAPGIHGQPSEKR